MTGHGDLETAVDVMRSGAFDFVTKPFSTPDLMKKIESALAASAAANMHAIEEQKIRGLTEQLTDKEGEVMRLMIAGKTTAKSPRFAVTAPEPSSCTGQESSTSSRYLTRSSSSGRTREMRTGAGHYPFVPQHCETWLDWYCLLWASR